MCGEINIYNYIQNIFWLLEDQYKAANSIDCALLKSIGLSYLNLENMGKSKGCTTSTFKCKDPGIQDPFFQNSPPIHDIKGV